MPNIPSLEDFIVVCKDVVPLSLCDEIVSEFKNSEEWVVSKVSTNVEKIDIRNCSSINLSDSLVINKNQKVRQKLDEALFLCASNAIKKYTDIHKNFLITQDTGYNLLKYQEGQYYRSHTDSSLNNNRAISCSISLNDDYEGGDFAFFDGKLKYKMPKGSVIMFPSNFMYPHEVMDITKNTRYSIVTWFL